MNTPPNTPASTEPGKRSPWLWIPSLYFAQGVPYVAVNTLSVVMYKRLGVSNSDITLYTSLLNFPWVLKLLWSPLVDLFRTKRLWIVATQALLALGLLAAGASVQTTAFFFMTLCVFWGMAFASATHDIAADGFYMLSLDTHAQAWWNGIRSTFYRVAMIVGSGLLIVLAGVLEGRNGLPPLVIPVEARPGADAAGPADPASIRATPLDGELRLVAHPESLTIPITGRTADEAKAVLDKAKAWNREHGFIAVDKPAEVRPEEESGWTTQVSKPIGAWWTAHVTDPLGEFLEAHFGRDKTSRPVTAGNVGVVAFTLSGRPPEGKEIVVGFDRAKGGLEYIGFGSGDRGVRLVEGERFVFTGKNWDQPFLAVLQLDPKLKEASSVSFVTRAGDIPLAWSITLFTLGGLFLAAFAWHALVLPRPAADGPVTSGRNPVREFFGTFGSWFRKPGIGIALAFLLLYRFPEAQALKLVFPFLLDAREAGGLGLSTSQVGLAYGTFGILALTFGGIYGALLAARHGFGRMLPVMVCAIHLPNFAFLYLSWAQPENFALISACIAVEQFGYGFGFAAYMLFMLYFSQGQNKTAHYAICTGFMALGIMLPGMWSGWLQERIGYPHFFFWIMLSTIPGFLVAFLVKVDPAFGKKA